MEGFHAPQRATASNNASAAYLLLLQLINRGEDVKPVNGAEAGVDEQHLSRRERRRGVPKRLQRHLQAQLQRHFAACINHTS